MATEGTQKYNLFYGTNNVHPGVRIKPKESGGTWLTESNNVHLDDTSALNSREGTTQVFSGECHSVFSTGRDLYLVLDGNLIKYSPDTGVTSGIHPGVGSTRMNYVRVNDQIFCTNSKIIGYIQDDIWNDFPDPTDTYKRKMPPGHLIEFYNGILYVAINNMVVFSDPMNFYQYDTREDENVFSLTSGRITLLKRCTDGLWTSDSTGVYYVHGTSPEDFKLYLKDTAPAIEGTGDYDYNITIDNYNRFDRGVIFNTTYGICAGFDGGRYYNFTSGNFAPISGTVGTSLVRKGAISEYISITR